MLHEIENWNKEKEEGIFKRREVKARIRAHEEALKEEERKKQEAALNTSQARPGTSSTAQNPDTSLAMTDGGEAPAEKVDEKPVPDEEKPDTDSDDEYQTIDIKVILKEFKKANQGVRFPVEMINEAVRWRLNQNDCQNRGYVLDGYPRSYQESFGVFFIQNKKPEPKFTIDEATGEKVQAPDEMDEDTLREYLKPKF